MRFITGKGQYTDDINLPGQTYAVFLRSPACAREDQQASSVRREEECRAWSRSSPASDIAADKVGGLPCGWLIHRKDGTPMKSRRIRCWRRARCATSATRSQS